MSKIKVQLTSLIITHGTGSW